MRNEKINAVEPHFQTSATLSWTSTGTKTAGALPHCSESTNESIAGWCSCGIEVRLEYGHKSMRKRNSNDLAPRFQTSKALLSQSLEGTKIAAALPYCSKSAKESIAGWCTFGLEVKLELCQNCVVPPYHEKTVVEAF